MLLSLLPSLLASLLDLGDGSRAARFSLLARGDMLGEWSRAARFVLEKVANETRRWPDAPIPPWTDGSLEAPPPWSCLQLPTPPLELPTVEDRH